MGERKVCVVSGLSSGIGAATVRLYARNGWDVVVNCSRDTVPAPRRWRPSAAPWASRRWWCGPMCR